MIGNSQRLQGYRSYGVRRAISSTPSKVTGLRRLQRSLSDKFQRYSPNFDIIIIIIILEVDIKGCEVAKVSGFHRAISTHITYHYWICLQGYISFFRHNFCIAIGCEYCQSLCMCAYLFICSLTPPKRLTLEG